MSAKLAAAKTIVRWQNTDSNVLQMTILTVTNHMNSYT